MKVYEGNWSAKTRDHLIRCIKMKQKESDQDIVIKMLDEFIWGIKMGYKAFRKYEMNHFLCLSCQKIGYKCIFIMIYIPVANFGTHPLCM